MLTGGHTAAHSSGHSSAPGSLAPGHLVVSSETQDVLPEVIRTPQVTPQPAGLPGVWTPLVAGCILEVSLIEGKGEVSLIEGRGKVSLIKGKGEGLLG